MSNQIIQIKDGSDNIFPEYENSNIQTINLTALQNPNANSCALRRWGHLAILTILLRYSSQITSGTSILSWSGATPVTETLATIEDVTNAKPIEIKVSSSGGALWPIVNIPANAYIEGEMVFLVN